MIKKINNFKDIALSVSRKAGNYLKENFGSFKVTKAKEYLHYGIKEDVVCNTIYENYLKRYTPKVSLYTEEGSRVLGSDFTWVVDPIDGTSNYAVGNPLFVTQIALLEKQEPILSVIYAPILKQEFVSIKGKGSFLNGNKVSVSKKVIGERFSVSFAKGREMIYSNWYIEVMGSMVKRASTPRVFGSAGIEMAYTAAGKLDCFLSNGCKIYDLVPGYLLIKEAGGLIVNDKGKEWSLKDSFLLAGNRKLVKNIQKIINH
jgi:myo-inositol-1(or 4)-monophosphatase